MRERLQNAKRINEFLEMRQNLFGEFPFQNYELINHFGEFSH